MMLYNIQKFIIYNFGKVITNKIIKLINNPYPLVFPIASFSPRKLFFKFENLI